MPYYSFKHPKKEKYIDVVFGMNDKKFYVDENGLEWERVWHKPQMAIDSSFVNVDPWDKTSFIKKTEKGGTIGDLWDRAAELSEKRGGDKNDPIKNEYLTKGYGKTRSGAEHPSIKKKRAEEACKKAGIRITPD